MVRAYFLPEDDVTKSSAYIVPRKMAHRTWDMAFVFISRWIRDIRLYTTDDCRYASNGRVSMSFYEKSMTENTYKEMMTVCLQGLQQVVCHPCRLVSSYKTPFLQQPLPNHLHLVAMENTNRATQKIQIFFILS